jgi:copper chaperone
MAEHKYSFNVTMTCGGCSGAVERVLKKTEGQSAPTGPLNQCLQYSDLTSDIYIGVKSYDVSLEKQTADVTTDDSINYATLLEKIKKTGKTVNSAEADGVAQAV